MLNTTRISFLRQEVYSELNLYNNCSVILIINIYSCCQHNIIKFHNHIKSLEKQQINDTIFITNKRLRKLDRGENNRVNLKLLKAW